MHDLSRDGAQYQACDSAHASRSHHDHVTAEPAGASDDCLGRLSDYDMRYMRELGQGEHSVCRLEVVLTSLLLPLLHNFFLLVGQQIERSNQCTGG
jgi:hypothetical protein